MSPIEDLLVPATFQEGRSSSSQFQPGRRALIPPEIWMVDKSFRPVTILKILSEEPGEAICIVHVDGDLPGTNFVRTINHRDLLEVENVD
jgi:hypothetical protein